MNNTHSRGSQLRVRLAAGVVAVVVGTFGGVAALASGQDASVSKKTTTSTTTQSQSRTLAPVTTSQS
jgi:hypothetical protein